MNDKSSDKAHELEKPIAIYYEHPDWFRPLFQQLDERGAHWVKVDVRDHHYDAASARQDCSLLFNRMSPSAGKRFKPAIFIRSTISNISKRRVCGL